MRLSAKEIIDKILDSKDLSAKVFSEKIGLDRPQAIYDIQKNKTKSVTAKMVDKIISVFPEISRTWLLTGEGEMLVNNCIRDTNKENGKIPFYDTVTVGGRDVESVLDPVSQPTTYIDAGDWFRNATAAMRHTGHSMVQYPKGCILALKEVYDRDLIIPGRDYVIETDEYRVTKQIQLLKKDYFTAYSTNEETYSDGNFIHPPFDIPMKKVKHIMLVLGYVVNENGNTIFYSNNKI